MNTVPNRRDQLFGRSVAASERLNHLVLAGARAHSKGDDQYADGVAAVISDGSGAQVWDVDVAVCSDEPFFSADDWFVGVTPMPAGTADAISELTLVFCYGDLAAADRLLQRYDGQIAGLIPEPTTQQSPLERYLLARLELARCYGTRVIFDEMITASRLSRSGGQGLFGVTPTCRRSGRPSVTVSRYQRWPVAVTSWSAAASATSRNGYSSCRQPTVRRRTHSQRRLP
jgi:glutamate-1-semialdehyde aminotransferase